MHSELFEKLMQLQWMMKKNRLRNCANGGHMADTTRGQGRILAVLKLRDGISTRDLSYLLGVRISSLNELLSKMEKNGYVTREPSEQDKRVMLVKLTEKGRNEEQAGARGSEDLFACLTEEEQKTFEAILDKMSAALHANFSEEDEEWFSKMDAMRERFGDIPGAPFGGRFYGRGEFGFDRFDRGDFPGHRDFGGRGRCGGE